MASEITHQLLQVVTVHNQASNSLLKPDPRLDHALTNSAAHGIPEISISDLQGQYLAVQCRLINAKSVLEIGTLGGYSTIWFARSGAKVTSIEINPKYRDVAIENTKGLDVDIILGAGLDVLPKLAAEGRKFDLVFIDASFDEQWEYFQWAVKLANKCIYVDNVILNMLEKGTAGDSDSLIAKVGNEDRVITTLVPTVSGHRAQGGELAEHMFDGFLLSVIKDSQ